MRYAIPLATGPPAWYRRKEGSIAQERRCRDGWDGDRHAAELAVHRAPRQRARTAGVYRRPHAPLPHSNSPGRSRQSRDEPVRSLAWTRELSLPMTTLLPILNRPFAPRASRAFERIPLSHAASTARLASLPA